MRPSQLSIRWCLKKAARQFVALISWGSGSLFVRQRVGVRPRVRVLTYHRVRRAARDPFSVTVSEFDRQMAWVASRRLAISLADLLAFLDGRGDIPDNAILVTIDDGYDDLRSGAVPVLVRHGVPAVAFIPAGKLGSIQPGESDRWLSRHEVATLEDYNVAVGSHAWDHESLGWMSSEQTAFQATRSRAELEAVTGRPVVAFAYPFGTQLDFNAMTRETLRAAGYRCAFTSQHGAVTRASDPLELRRVKIEGGDPFWVFRLAVRGGLDLWRLVDRFAARFQVTDHTGLKNRDTAARRRSASVPLPN